MPTTRLLALLPTLLLAACGDANTSSSSGAASRGRGPWPTSPPWRSTIASPAPAPKRDPA